MKRENECPLCGEQLYLYEIQKLYSSEPLKQIWFCSDINCSYKKEGVTKGRCKMKYSEEYKKLKHLYGGDGIPDEMGIIWLEVGLNYNGDFCPRHLPGVVEAGLCTWCGDVLVGSAHPWGCAKSPYLLPEFKKMKHEVTK